MNDHSPEIDLLLATSRKQLAGNLPDLLSSPPGAIQWDRLLQLAQQHATLPRLCLHLIKTGQGWIPSEVLTHLKSRLLEIQKQNLLLSAELIRLLKEFERHQIQVAALRGPLLAQMLYQDPALRISSDLDFLVPPDDLDRARQLLQKLGYRRDFQGTPIQERLYRKWQCEDHHSHPESNIMVELHWDLLPRHYHVRLPWERIWQRIQPVEWQGMACPAPCPEDNLIMLCAHAWKHGWSQLNQAADLAGLIEESEGIDWKLVLREARQAGVLRPLLIGLALVQRLYQFPLPERVQPPAKEKKKAERIIRQWFAEAAQTAHPQSHVMREITGRLGGSDSRILGLVGLLHYLVVPTIPDWEWIQFPSWLHGLYYAFRPFRLFWQNRR